MSGTTVEIATSEHQVAGTSGNSRIFMTPVSYVNCKLWTLISTDRKHYVNTCHCLARQRFRISHSKYS